ncbi:MAG: PHP domain-containing protein [bacterium]
MRFYDCVGAIHLHSIYSDGSGTMEEIVESAKEAGLDFIMVTDHSDYFLGGEGGWVRCDPFGAQELGYEGWHDGVLVIIGVELNASKNHYLAFGLRESVDCREKTAQECIDEVARRGGFGFIAHPDHTANALLDIPSYAWRDWTVTGFAGLGIWNLMEDWAQNLKGILGAIGGYLFPERTLRGPSPTTLQRWDDMVRKSRVVGIGEIDNHAKRKRIMGVRFTVFPYLRAFRTIRNHLILPEPLSRDSAGDTQRIYEALRRGGLYISNDYWHPAEGFSFIAESGGREGTMGDEIALDGEVRFHISLPKRGIVRIIKDGRTLWEGMARDHSLRASDPGAYRVEAHYIIRGAAKPWIFSNHIYVGRREDENPRR